MNAPDPAFVKLPEKPCIGCGSADFQLIQVAQHLARVCCDCQRRQPGWMARADAGIGKRNIKREDIGFGVRAEVLQRWKHRCAWCGISATEAMLHIGHIIPRARVEKACGVELADSPLNLAPTCETCNAGAHLTNELAIDLLLCALRLSKC